MINDAKINRRELLKIVPGALCLAYAQSSLSTEGAVKKVSLAEQKSIAYNQFITLYSDGRIVFANHLPEMGQGSLHTTLTILAEELDVDVDQVDFYQSDVNREHYGDQTSWGSKSTKDSWERCRVLAATVRHMLMEAAVNTWKIPLNECSTQSGRVLNHLSGKSFTYGQLANSASYLIPPKSISLKNKSEYKQIGKPQKRRDNQAKINGSAIFGMDVKVPGMLAASVTRCPYFHGEISSYNRQELLSIPGVVDVIETQMQVLPFTRRGIAIIAKDFYTANEARKYLRIKWEKIDKTLDSSDIYHHFEEQVNKTGITLEANGNIEALAELDTQDASLNLSQSYFCPYQAHACMEPLNATAHVTENHCELWAPIQAPQWTQDALANLLGLKWQQVKINVTYLGGGFGRKSIPDFCLEAAYLSQKLQKPVKVIWTREDDITQGPFRFASLNHLQAKLTEEGEIESLTHTIIAQDQANQIEAQNPNSAEKYITNGITDYAIANRAYKFNRQFNKIPISWFRGVYAPNNAFAHESFIDEICAQTHQNPMTVRLKLLAHKPRHTRVLKALSNLVNWNEKSKCGCGKGIAITELAGCVSAHCVKVSYFSGKLKIDKVVSVIDCGIIINPDTVKAQNEGGVLMMIKDIKYSGIQIKSGAAVESNFDDYPIPTITDMPLVETLILDSDVSPQGVGEAVHLPFLPALANAIYEASGKRIRQLPFDIDFA
ncbi:xanthine dehydrogenase family protein molybdopterin-binding subunit [Teredinibacter sp. KSP-S5-2]|uniref:xanthine dehydrogenase family protein molybdopterin-binding subunit n=1 Tax=Teredinibacter sp. KSP-S5-2 TaxID=3034506 RepID=UPI0029348237|nr:molybdopterin cofactor-binding domain-containing protein [Teredinibacter sp. KSP-S5-2]WNO11229.1 molybdopterin-dependent oxidoreductase [Teredinibacter sp. KSP-S5-2]